MAKKVAFQTHDPNSEEINSSQMRELSLIPYHSLSLQPSNSQSKTILKNPLFDEKTNRSFVTSLKEEHQNALKKHLQPNDTSELKFQQLQQNIEQQEIVEIIIPSIILEEKSHRLKSLGNERKSKTQTRQMSSIDLRTKLPHLKSFLITEQTSRDQIPEKERIKIIRKEPMKDPTIFCSSSTRDLMARLREDILEKHEKPNLNTERVARQKAWERQDELMNRIDSTRNKISDEKKKILKCMEKNNRQMLFLTKKHYDTIYRNEGIRFLLERPVELPGVQFYTYKKDGRIYYKKRLGTEKRV